MKKKLQEDIFGVSKALFDKSKNIEKELIKEFNKIDEICMYNTAKVMNAFEKNRVSEIHFNKSTGYGYDDLGRETIEKIYKNIFGTEDALVRIQFVNGTHALSTALYACLESEDVLMSITGSPYDTLCETIGIKENSLSLIQRGIKYEQIELLKNDFDEKEILKKVKKYNPKLIFIGRSRGYSIRESICLSKIKEIIQKIKDVQENVIIMVDNCYGEFVEKIEPTDVGADIIAGSLIKNIGGSLCETGGYIVGKKEYIERASEILTAPGIGKECGATLGKNKEILQGLYMSPHIVSQALKVAIFTSKILEELGFEVFPKYSEKRTDIIQSVILNSEEKLVKFIQGIQKASPVDSFVSPEAWDMPGYSNKVIMAAGTFVSGASIELSADAPIKEPYIAYIQGAITYESGKIAILKAIDNMLRGEI